MTVYICQIYDSLLGDRFDLGVFSTSAKAESAGTDYIMEECPESVAIDWMYEDGTRVDWYQTPNGYTYTRMIIEAELDKAF